MKVEIQISTIEAHANTYLKARIYVLIPCLKVTLDP